MGTMWSSETESPFGALALRSIGSPQIPQIHPSLSKISVSLKFSVGLERSRTRRRWTVARPASGCNFAHLSLVALTRSGLALADLLALAFPRSVLAAYQAAALALFGPGLTS